MKQRTAFLSAAALAAASILSSATRVAYADSNKIAAEALFQEGRRLMGEGKFADACPKFADSARLDPSAGTLLNLGSCYEKWGHIASAWASYQEAASLANSSHKTELMEAAERHSTALAPRLARITITAPHGTDTTEVRRDGDKIARAEWGVPIPVDPGKHVVTASAPGFHDWSAEVSTSKEGETVTVTVPELEALPAAPAPVAAAPTPAAPETATAPVSTPAPAPHGMSGLRIAGLTIGGVGIVSLGAAGVFAALAKSKNSASMSGCNADLTPNLCSPTGLSERNSALTFGNVATGTLIGGGALLAAGAVIFFAAPSGQTQGSSGHGPQFALVPTLGGATLTGQW